MPFDLELEVARQAAAVAGKIALRYWRTGIQADTKPDDSPVTVADRECEQAVKALLAEEFPDDGFIGEESGIVESCSGRRWIVDPIDGTRDFVRGNRFFANLIALEARGEVVVGVANFPALSECYYAAKGGGAFADGESIHASSIESPGQAVLHFNSLDTCLKKPYAGRVLPFFEQFWAVRCLGGPHDSMAVAAGRAELWVEQSGKIWDLAPLKVIAEEAGAVFFNFNGESRADGGNCIIANRHLAKAAREFLGL